MKRLKKIPRCVRLIIIIRAITQATMLKDLLTKIGTTTKFQREITPSKFKVNVVGYSARPPKERAEQPWMRVAQVSTRNKDTQLASPYIMGNIALDPLIMIPVAHRTPGLRPEVPRHDGGKN
jgi:hypothetical protein